MSHTTVPGRHVFLVRSSLQFLLASAIAEDQRRQDGTLSRMVFLPDVLDPGLFAHAIDDWTDRPFDRVVFVAARRGPGDARPTRGGGAVRRELRTALADAQPISVTVFNDREEPGQAILVEAARRFPDALRRCAEDGALSYTGFTYPLHSRLVALRQRLRLGAGWANVRVLGTHPLVQQYLALHPGLLRPELRMPNVRQLPVAPLGSDALRRVARAFCTQANFDPDRVPAGAAVLTLSHSNYARRNPGYLASVGACLSALQAADKQVFVKCHPREIEVMPLGEASQGVIEIARTIPVECLWLLLRDRPLCVIGGMSTSLLTAALLMPQARVMALPNPPGSQDTWDEALLGALGIAPWTPDGD